MAVQIPESEFSRLRALSDLFPKQPRLRLLAVATSFAVNNSDRSTGFSAISLLHASGLKEAQRPLVTAAGVSSLVGAGFLVDRSKSVWSTELWPTVAGFQVIENANEVNRRLAILASKQQTADLDLLRDSADDYSSLVSHSGEVAASFVVPHEVSEIEAYMRAAYELPEATAELVRYYKERQKVLAAISRRYKQLGGASGAVADQVRLQPSQPDGFRWGHLSRDERFDLAFGKDNLGVASSTSATGIRRQQLGPFFEELDGPLAVLCAYMADASLNPRAYDASVGLEKVKHIERLFSPPVSNISNLLNSGDKQNGIDFVTLGLLKNLQGNKGGYVHRLVPTQASLTAVRNSAQLARDLAVVVLAKEFPHWDSILYSRQHPRTLISADGFYGSLLVRASQVRRLHNEMRKAYESDEATKALSDQLLRHGEMLDNVGDRFQVVVDSPDYDVPIGDLVDVSTDTWDNRQVMVGQKPGTGHPVALPGSNIMIWRKLADVGSFRVDPAACISLVGSEVLHDAISKQVAMIVLVVGDAMIRPEVNDISPLHPPISHNELADVLGISSVAVGNRAAKLVDDGGPLVTFKGRTLAAVDASSHLRNAAQLYKQFSGDIKRGEPCFKAACDLWNVNPNGSVESSIGFALKGPLREADSDYLVVLSGLMAELAPKLEKLADDFDDFVADNGGRVFSNSKAKKLTAWIEAVAEAKAERVPGRRR